MIRSTFLRRMALAAAACAFIDVPWPKAGRASAGARWSWVEPIPMTDEMMFDAPMDFEHYWRAALMRAMRGINAQRDPGITYLQSEADTL